MSFSFSQGHSLRRGYGALRGGGGGAVWSRSSLRNSLAHQPRPIAQRTCSRFVNSSSSAPTESYKSPISASRFSRRQLIPLVRLLHPDMHAMCSLEVRQSNAAVIQDLYSIVDYLDEIHMTHTRPTAADGAEAAAAHKKQTEASSGKVRSSPLQKTYDLTFYAFMDAVEEKKGGDRESTLKLTAAPSVASAASPQQFKLHVKPPLAFQGMGAARNLTTSQALRAIDKMATQLSALFTLVGEAAPATWSNPALARGASGRSRINKHGEVVENEEDGEDWWDIMGNVTKNRGVKSSKSAFDMSAVDERMFERHITRTSRLRNSAHMSYLEHQKYDLFMAEQKKAERDAQSFQVESSDTDTLTAFDSAAAVEPRKPPRMGSKTAILQSEVDTYIRSAGRVLLRGVALEQEIEAISHLRSFLLQYGPTLNFCYDNWCMVTMVLEADSATSDGSSSKQQGQKKKRRNDSTAYRAIYAEKVIKDQKHLHTQARARNANTHVRNLISTDSDSDSVGKGAIPVVVEFPSDFRAAMLLDVLLGLPAASVLRDRA